MESEVPSCSLSGEIAKQSTCGSGFWGSYLGNGGQCDLQVRAVAYITLSTTS